MAQAMTAATKTTTVVATRWPLVTVVFFHLHGLPLSLRKLASTTETASSRLHDGDDNDVVQDSSSSSGASRPQ
ncbi:uncharacterized protein DS421_19g654390 [Arachis hypogaea]|uniref:Uncharacterized protein n=1 Tax=Arachis hypogaea TaxID=3818 RepID=A0A6B9VBJ5_ARAHY|nr:uncharacterized protein DS421_19g654390 [Arachis hypogaea]